MIVVKPNQEYELNTQKLDSAGLSQRLTKELENRIDKTVFIKAPTKLPYKEIVGVIDLAKGAGATPIGLQIDFLQEK